MQGAINKIPLASFMDHDKTGHVIIDPIIYQPFCDLCNSFECIHVKSAMSIKQVRVDFTEALGLICDECGNYNSKDADYCIKCGSKLAGVQ